MSPRERDTDGAFVEQVLAGDREAVRRFVERMRCVPRILVRKNAQLGRPLSDHEIEDLGQEVLAALWRKLPQYNGTAALETWAYRFCYLELMRHLRTKHGLPKQLEDPLEGSTLEPQAPPPPSPEDTARVLAALDGMDAEEADVIRLKHFEDMTFEAIGERLALSPNTAKTRYYRGLKKLERLLRETTGGRVPRRVT